MTNSQKEAIEKQKRIMKSVHPNCQFVIYTPHNTDIVRLVCQFKMRNMLCQEIDMSETFTIGKRGKISQEQIFWGRQIAR